MIYSNGRCCRLEVAPDTGKNDDNIQSGSTTVGESRSVTAQLSINRNNIGKVETKGIG